MCKWGLFISLGEPGIRIDHHSKDAWMNADRTVVAVLEIRTISLGAFACLLKAFKGFERLVEGSEARSEPERRKPFKTSYLDKKCMLILEGDN